MSADRERRDDLLQKKKSITRALEKLENDMQTVLHGKDDGLQLFKIQTVMHILKVYLGHLDTAIKDSNYENKLSQKHMKLQINDILLEKLELEDRLTIMCLTAGQCGI